MKKGIEVSSDHDKQGRWCLRVRKARGRLTRDEIEEAARDWEWDFYLMLIDAYHCDEDEQQFTESQSGDIVTLYRTDLWEDEK